MKRSSFCEMKAERLILVLLLLAVQCSAGEEPSAPRDLSKIAGWAGRNPDPADTFRFAVVSDRTGNKVQGAWPGAVDELNLLKPDFIMSVGDLIEGYTSDISELKRRWQECDRITGKLDAPFFYCPGNHETSGEIPKKVYAAPHGSEGRTYYSFDFGGCHFVVLDTTSLLEADPMEPAAQWRWLRKDLSKAVSASHVFVFGHHPPGNPNLWPHLSRLLPNERSTVFSGHEHRQSYFKGDGISSLTLGPTAAKGKRRSLAFVTVTGGKPTIAIMPLYKVSRHDSIIDKKAQRRAGSVRRERRLSAVMFYVWCGCSPALALFLGLVIPRVRPAQL